MFDKEGLGTVLLSSVKDAQLGSRIRSAHFAKLTGEWPFVIYFLFFFIQQKNATKRKKSTKSTKPKSPTTKRATV